MAFRLAITICMLVGGMAVARACEDSDLEVQSVQGVVEVQRANEIVWRVISTGALLCVGDSLRAGENSLVSFVGNDSAALLNENTKITIRGPENGKRRWYDIFTGLFKINVRQPDAVGVTAPFANAGIKGTEIFVMVDGDRSVFAAVSGNVSLEPADGASFEINSGGIASFGPESAVNVASLSATMDPEDFSRAWFRMLVPESLPPGLVLDGQATADQFVRRAAGRMRAGKIREAQEDLDSALDLEPGNAMALVLRAQIDLALGRTAEAENALDKVLVDAPSFVPASIVRADANVRRGEIEDARRLLEQAVISNPTSAIAWIFLAELRLAAGEPRGAAEAADEAERHAPSAPSVAGIAAIRGYIELWRNNGAQAISYFESAIGMDDEAPSPRIGLAAALWWQGRGTEASRQWETAVILDPGNASARGLLALKFLEQGRFDKVQEQIELNLQANPSDPGAHANQALEREDANDPYGSIQASRRSLSLNNGILEPGPGSRLLRGRQTALANNVNAYQRAGFDPLVLSAARQGIVNKPNDPAVLGIYRDSMAKRVFAQLTRASLEEQISNRGMIGLSAPLMSQQEYNPGLNFRLAPSVLAVGPYASPLPTEGSQFRLSTVAAGNSTSGMDVGWGYISGNFALDAGYYGFRTDGLGENDFAEQDVLQIRMQFRMPRTYVTAEIRGTDVYRGNNLRTVAEQGYGSSFRQTEDSFKKRLSVVHEMEDGGEIVASLETIDLHQDIVDPPVSETWVNSDNHRFELQHSGHAGNLTIVKGFRYVKGKPEQRIFADLPEPLPDFEQFDSSLRSTRALYTYALIDIGSHWTATLGGSFEEIDYFNITDQDFYPKLALNWRSDAGTTISAAAFETLHLISASKLVIHSTLEPVHVGGFEQHRFGSVGDKALTQAIAIDHGFSDRLFIGAEFRYRDIETSIYQLSPVPGLTFGRTDEKTESAYINWAPRHDLTLSVELILQDFNNHGNYGISAFSQLNTQRLPIEVNFFSPGQWSVGTRTTFVAQQGQFGIDGFPEPQGEFYGEEDFSVTDLSFTYKLPGRRGQFEFGVNNIFDRQFTFQDTDPESPLIVPERIAFGRLTWLF